MPPSGPSGTRRATRRSWSSRKVGKSESRKVGKSESGRYGIRTALLERGRRFRTRDFPSLRLSDLPTFRPSSHLPSMPNTLDDFDAFRSRMNETILGAGNLTINRFFALEIGRAHV